jgi:hypothetical protein
VLAIIRHCAKLNLLDIREFDHAFDQVVRRELYANKLWLGAWKDRHLKIQLTSQF